MCKSGSLGSILAGKHKFPYTPLESLIEFNLKYIFIWLRWVLGVAHWIFAAAFGIFSCGTWTLSCSMWDLVLWPGMELRPPVLGVCCLSHWTPREVPEQLSLTLESLSCRHSPSYHGILAELDEGSQETAETHLQVVVWLRLPWEFTRTSPRQHQEWILEKTCCSTVGRWQARQEARVRRVAVTWLRVCCSILICFSPWSSSGSKQTISVEEEVSPQLI